MQSKSVAGESLKVEAENLLTEHLGVKVIQGEIPHLVFDRCRGRWSLWECWRTTGLRSKCVGWKRSGSQVLWRRFEHASEFLIEDLNFGVLRRGGDERIIS